MVDNYLNIRKHKYNKNPLIEYICRRVRNNNLNFLMLIVGGTGSGKTYGGLRISELCDPDFKINQCVFRLKHFMALINQDPPFKKGSCMVFDEIGVEANKKNWYSQTNKMLNYVAQTFRHQNYITIFTTPDASFVDSSLMKLFHCVARTQRVDRNNKILYIKPLFIETNPMTGKIYRKKLRFWTPNGTKVLNEVGLRLPSKELINDYEIKKKKFTKELNEEIEKELSIEKNKKGALTEQQKQILDLVQNHKQEDVAQKLGIYQSLVARQIKSIRKKGYEVPFHHKSPPHKGKHFNPINAIRALENNSGGNEDGESKV